MRLALTALAVSRCNLPKKSADGESRQRLFEYRTSKIERCHGLVPSGIRQMGRLSTTTSSVLAMPMTPPLRLDQAVP